LLLQSCLGTQYLQKNEYLLADQYAVGNKKIKNRELEPYYLQHTNRKVLGMPVRLWIYELGRRNFNKKAIKKQYKRVELSYNQKLAAAANQPKLFEELRQAKKKKLEHYESLLKNGNFLMRNGEPPAIYTPQKRLSTENNLLQYLHTKGFFNAHVGSRLKIKDKKVYVIYKITENQPFIVKDMILRSSDLALEELLQPYEQQSLLKKKTRYDQDVLIAERERIYDLLVNNGYWGFNKQYIAFNVDTTANDSSITIETVVSLPIDRQSHQIYQLDSIEFSISSRHLELHTEDVTTKGGITFHNISQHFKPHVITNKIPLRQGQLYRKRDIIEVQKRLTNLGIFKDIHVSYDILDETRLRTHIHISLLDKFQLEQEVGTKFTSSSTIPFYELSFKSRNLLKKLELLILKTQFSAEIGSLSTDQQKIYNEQNAGLGLELNLPQFLVPLPRSIRTRLDAYRPHTKVSLNYTVGNQPNYWSQDFKTLISYEWQPNIHTTYELIPLSVSLRDYKLSEKYKEHLKEDFDKRKSEYDDPYKRYKYSLLTSSAIKVNFRSSEEQKSRYLYLGELLLESGGSLQNLIDFKKLFGSQLTYYRYLKCSIAYNQHIPIQEGTIFAYHVNTGILYPYSIEKAAPADKYFFVGGPNSIRAWGSRSLGPGSSPNKDTSQNQFFEERSGEFILQANAEIRQQLIGFIEGAVFVDMGNVWMLHKTERQGEDFELNRFYKESAIGTGVGIRLNFNFLVLRLDVGFKLYDPGLPVGARFFPETIAPPTIQFGLGYPF